MSANDAAPAGATALIVGVAVTRPVPGAECAGDGVRLPARTRPIIAPTAMARPMVIAANRLLRCEGIVKGGCCAARPLSRNQLPEGVLVQHRNAQRPRLLGFAAGVGADHHGRGLLAH